MFDIKKFYNDYYKDEPSKGQTLVEEGEMSEDSSPNATFDVDKFLDTTSGIESSFGRNKQHKQLQHGMHKGMSAIGSFGLMPNTVDDIIKNIVKDTEHPTMQKLLTAAPEMKKRLLEANPKVERYLARKLANYLKNKGLSEEQANIAWQYGHNLPQERLNTEDERYKDRMAKWNKFRQMMNSYAVKE